MLTDIFAKRYSKVFLWQTFTEVERRLLVQSVQIVVELMPYPSDPKKASEATRSFWLNLDTAISRELGMLNLSPRFASNGYEWSPLMICQNWAYGSIGAEDPDEYMKQRLSLVELGLRNFGQNVAAENATLEKRIQDCLAEKVYGGTRIRMPADSANWMKVENRKLNDRFSAAVDELNARFREARARLHFHNGFIQLTDDDLHIAQIEEPFWKLVIDKKWENVDHDMKEAIDLYGNGGRDPAWYAARALESAIKIISNTNGWTRGTEKGAAHYVDNLVSKGNGRFLDVWEGDVLRDFFAKVRNPFGHGPGEEPMPSLTPEQTIWAIRTCMAWVTSLVTRMKT
ncbi:hypothetical protein RLW55_03200 [Hyphomicrobium sp. B1]|uniref:AbiJ-NTD4 domain-containing protein n=1 Tax=Hyphomicrobium sp. B1 TaxID=3075651 RepID=UPI003C2BF000